MTIDTGHFLIDNHWSTEEHLPRLKDRIDSISGRSFWMESANEESETSTMRARFASASRAIWGKEMFVIVCIYFGANEILVTQELSEQATIETWAWVWASAWWYALKASDAWWPTRSKYIVSSLDLLKATINWSSPTSAGERRSGDSNEWIKKVRRAEWYHSSELQTW